MRNTSTKTNKGRKIVYRYNGDPRTEESALDLLEEIPIPIPGSLITRKARRWKVISVDKLTDRDKVPTHRVYLSERP